MPTGTPNDPTGQNLPGNTVADIQGKKHTYSSISQQSYWEEFPANRH